MYSANDKFQDFFSEYPNMLSIHMEIAAKRLYVGNFLLIELQRIEIDILNTQNMCYILVYVNTLTKNTTRTGKKALVVE